MADLQHDLVVVGGGIAGMTAASRAAQLGLKVLVLEQGTSEQYLCNTRYTGGTFHICLRNVMADKAELKKAITVTTSGFVNDGLAEAIATDGSRSVRWLQEEGIRFMSISGAEYHKWTLAPPGRGTSGLDWRGRGGDVLLRTLEKNLNRRGGTVLRGARARSLVLEGSRCRGVGVDRGGQTVSYGARGVVIADGGFQGNAALVREYICANPHDLKQRSAGTGCGDGLLMAAAVGAQLVGMGAFYGHVLSRNAMTNDKLWPYPYLDAIAAAGIVVDSAGRRFVDEGRGGIFIANAISRRADALQTSAIFDQAIWESVGRAGLIPANPHVAAAGGTILRSDDLASLATQLAVDPVQLAETVNAYNAHLKDGRLASLEVPRSAARQAPRLLSAPFYAAPLCVGITATMGGIAVSDHAEALDVAGNPIDGLYAAGGAAGGLEGGPELGYVGGLVKCGVTGLRSAEHLARSLGKAG